MEALASFVTRLPVSGSRRTYSRPRRPSYRASSFGVGQPHVDDGEAARARGALPSCAVRPRWSPRSPKTSSVFRAMKAEPEPAARAAARRGVALDDEGQPAGDARGLRPLARARARRALPGPGPCRSPRSPRPRAARRSGRCPRRSSRIGPPVLRGERRDRGRGRRGPRAGRRRTGARAPRRVASSRGHAVAIGRRSAALASRTVLTGEPSSPRAR